MRSALLLVCVLLMGAATTAQPIRLLPENPHYFQYRGKALAVVSSGEHYGAVLNADFDYVRYLDQLQKDGMNYTRVFTGSYVEKQGDFGIRYNTLAPAPGRFIAPWARSAEPGFALGGNKFDLDAWDEAYFDRLKDFIAQAEMRDIIVEVTLFSALYDAGWTYSPLYHSNNINSLPELPRDSVYSVTGNGDVGRRQEQLVRKIVAELNGFDNVIYELQNEPWASPGRVWGPLAYNHSENWATENWQGRIEIAPLFLLEWQKFIARTIRDEESRLPERHLIAQNYANFTFPIDQVDPNVDILNFHYAFPEAVDLNYGWDRVIGFDESGFSGSSDVIYRRQAWRFMLSGGGLFNNLDYSFAPGFEDGTAANEAPGGGSPAFRKQMRTLRTFLEVLPLAAVRPDNRVVKLSSNAYSYALGDPGQAYGIYITGVLSNDLQLRLPDGSYEATWIFPENGREVKRADVMPTGGIATLTPPSYTTDIALRLIRR